MNRFYRKALVRYLRNFRGGQLTIVDGQEIVNFGSHGDSALRTTIEVHDPKFYRRVVRESDLGLADSYLQGEWSCDDLTSLIRMFIRDANTAERIGRSGSWLSRFARRMQHALRRNTKAKARQNIYEHYDLGNEFFREFLDETMSYSCGIFDSLTDSMKGASIRKIRRACEALGLRAGTKLLEIGTGWGELAAVAAEEFGCEVTTTTISRNQFEAARQKFADRGLDGVEPLQDDYRDLTGQFDCIVSIEMIEAVGHHYFKSFFDKCASLLKPDGKMMLQAIVIEDSKYARYVRDVDFIRAYIFPGGCLPSISVMSDASSRAGMRLVALDDFAPHYAETLRRWQQKFNQNRAKISDMGFDARFMRMWEYYLKYCEAAFEERQVNLVQAVFAKRACDSHDGFGQIPGAIKSAAEGFQEVTV